MRRSYAKFQRAKGRGFSHDNGVAAGLSVRFHIAPKSTLFEESPQWAVSNHLKSCGREYRPAIYNLTRGTFDVVVIFSYLNRRAGLRRGSFRLATTRGGRDDGVGVVYRDEAHGPEDQPMHPKISTECLNIFSLRIVHACVYDLTQLAVEKRIS